MPWGKQPPLHPDLEEVAQIAREKKHQARDPFQIRLFCVRFFCVSVAK